METSAVRLQVPGHDVDLEVVRYGAWGRPVLLFPSEGGVGPLTRRATACWMPCAPSSRQVGSACSASTRWTGGRGRPMTSRPRSGPAGADLHGVAVAAGAAVDPGAGRWGTGDHHRRRLAGRLPRGAPDLSARRRRTDGDRPLRQLRPDEWNGWGELGDATYFANPTAYVPRTWTVTTSTGSGRGSPCCSSSAKAPSRSHPPGRCRPPAVRGPAGGQGDSPRARRVGPRQRPRLAVVARSLPTTSPFRVT
jgi:hypothetical protein